MYETPPIKKNLPFDSRDRTLHSAHSDPDPPPLHHEKKPEPGSKASDEEVAKSKASHLPPAFLERGKVLSGEEMTTRYTDEEWEGIVAEAEKGLVVDEGRKYPLPEGGVGGQGLMKTIDHTLLKLEAKSGQFDELCAEARVNKFATVCVRPQWVSKCVADLKGSDIRVASVIGFHEGTHDLSTKIQELRSSIQDGALELDVVTNWRELKAKQYASIYNELATLRSQAPHPVLLKLILETSQLDRRQIIAGCVLAGAANFDFVKTSTGFNGPGASVENVRLMAACCERLAVTDKDGKVRQMKVKASGGIRTLDDAVKMLEAGASRLGTSGGVWIAKEAKQQADGGAESNGERPGMTTRLFTDY